jgi:hypothetical protein
MPGLTFAQALVPGIDVLAIESSREAWPRAHGAKEHPMLDLVMVAFGLGLFVVSVGYAYACDRL